MAADSYGADIFPEKHTAASLADMIERDYFPMPRGKNLYLSEHEWTLVLKALRGGGPNGERNYKDIAVSLRSISDAHSELYDSERFWLKEAAAVLDGLDATGERPE